MISQLNDYELIYNIKNGSSEAVVEFANRHEGLIVSSMSRVFNGSGISAETLNEEKFYVVNSAARSYKTEFHTKPSTWVCNIARFHALNLLKDYRKHNVSDGVDLDEITNIIDKVKVDESQKDAEKNDSINYIRELAANCSDKRIKQIIDIRYFNKEKRLLSYKDTGARLTPKLSTQGVKNLLDGFLKRVKISIKLENL